MRQLGLVTGLSSTAERHIGDLTIVSRLTTPEASEMHALLARMRESGVRAVAVEVSAQALTRHRVDGLRVRRRVVHQPQPRPPRRLRRHGGVLPGEAAAVPARPAPSAGSSRLDTAYGARVVEESRIPVTTIATVGHSAEVDERRVGRRGRSTRPPPTPSSGSPGPEGRSLVTREPLIGWHMAANAALAIVMLVEAGFELEAIGAALERRRRHPGLPSRAHRAGLGRPRPERLRRLRPQPGRVREHPRRRAQVHDGPHDHGVRRRRRPGCVQAPRDGPRRGRGLRHPGDHRPPPAFRGPGVDPRHPARGCRARRPTSPRSTRSARPRPRSARPSRSRARATRSSGRARATRTTATSRVSALRTRRATGARGAARGGLGVIALTTRRARSRRSADVWCCLPDGDCATTPSSTAPSRPIPGSSRAGSVFFALPGEVTDGHLFAPAAVEAGAALVVVERELDARRAAARGRRTGSPPWPRSPGSSSRGCARSARCGSSRITGSNGKTTTKNLLRAILERRGRRRSLRRARSTTTSARRSRCCGSTRPPST